MNAPKRIWADKNALWWLGEGKERVQYIRADLVDGLVDALEAVLPFTFIGNSEEANEATSKAVKAIQMKESWDSHLFNPPTGADEFDAQRMDGTYYRKYVSCKRCGTQNLYWKETVFGWRLFGNKRLHVCKTKNTMEGE